jgi:hypothetical protein
MAGDPNVAALLGTLGVRRFAREGASGIFWVDCACLSQKRNGHSGHESNRCISRTIARIS